ncbi:hypothetical protein DER45DRAFT_549059 [Fusarium avenaceum]|nr:hypothetical protein DER45DRAFT_549059 [Fusarium avenaceum]
MAQSAVPLMGPIYGPSAINSFDTMPQLTWEQHWTVDRLNFPVPHEASEGNIQHKYEIEDFVSNDAYTPALTNLASSVFSQEYSTPLETPELISPGKPTSNSDSRQRSSSTPSDNQQRKPIHTKRERAKSLRRDSSKQTQAKGVAGEVHKNITTGHKAAERNSSPLQYNNNERTRKHQERNRHAAKKCRIKKRADQINLESVKKDMEQDNHDLLICVTDLKSQVYDLKMKLLQHTDCNCALIQKYIANDASRFIEGLEN